MLKKLLIAMSAIFLSNTSNAETVTLTKSNTVVFSGVFTESNVTKTEAAIQKLDKKLPEGDPIYLYLETPGGSIDAGMNLINYVNSLDREVKTITAFAASMGFVTVEQLGERLVTPDGILMSHRAKIGLDGQIPGEFNTRSDFYLKLITQEETVTAKRLGLNLTDYRRKIINEYWVSGQAAVDEGAADRVVSVKCGEDMTGTHKETVQVFIFQVEVTLADCPLIRGPLAVEAPKGRMVDMYPIEASKVTQIVNKMYSNPANFVEQYILDNSYSKWFN